MGVNHVDYVNYAYSAKIAITLILWNIKTHYGLLGAAVR